MPRPAVVSGSRLPSCQSGRPPASTSPKLGGVSPAKILSIVVLPHPERPTSATNSRRRTLNETSRSATTVPLRDSNCFVIPRSSSALPRSACLGRLPVPLRCASDPTSVSRGFTTCCTMETRPAPSWPSTSQPPDEPVREPPVGRLAGLGEPCRDELSIARGPALGQREQEILPARRRPDAAKLREARFRDVRIVQPVERVFAAQY